MKKLVFLAMLFLLNATAAFPYSEGGHEKLNQEIIGNSNITANLKKINIALTDSFKEESVYKLIVKGGVNEDSPFWRSLYHFHDPVNNSGLKGATSSVVWAQDSGNEWSWASAREYLYRALTAQSGTERESNYAKTFEAIGHVMHLIEDGSIPAHTRDDIHIIKSPLYNYEHGFHIMA